MHLLTPSSYGGLSSPQGSDGSVTSALVERVRDPFLFAFMVSLATWNWRFAYVVLRGGTAAVQTIELAHAQVRSHPLVVPLAAAVTFVALHPWIRGAVSLLRTQADVAFANWRKRLIERQVLLSIVEWRDQSEYAQLIKRGEVLSKAVNFTMERLRIAWIERRPGGSAAPGSIVVDRFPQAQPFEGFAILTKRGYLRADEKTVSREIAPQIAYVLDALPTCGSAIVATAPSPVPIPDVAGSVRGLALLRDGAEVEFYDETPPPDALAWVRYSSSAGGWGVFEIAPRR